MLKAIYMLPLGDGWRLSVDCFETVRISKVFKRKHYFALYVLWEYDPDPLYPPELHAADAMRTRPTGFYLN